MSAEPGHPRRRWRFGRWALITLVMLAIAVVALLPSAPASVSIVSWLTTRTTVRGAYHIHSNRSDGGGTLDDIAAAASRAGLQFVILTDHGDGTRPPEAPSYRHGVLCIDGVELNTTDGHYVALGLSAAPYPIAGSAESVVEDVSRLGGFGFAAHADSARQSFQWRDWGTPFDGLEWLNADSEWRDESWGALTRAALTYWVRPPGTLTSLLDRPTELIAKWDELTRSRPVPVLAGADAHARLGMQHNDSYTGAWNLPLPDYESSFRVFSNHVVLDRAFDGDAAGDAGRLLTAIRRGRTFTVIDGLAGPGAFEFTAKSGDGVATIGDDLELHGPATLRARIAAPAGASLVLLRNGEVVKQTPDSDLTAEVTQRGSYRIEVALADRSRLPWLFSNPIYVGFDRRAPSPSQLPPLTSQVAVVGEARTESSPGSIVELDQARGLAWRYRLSPGVAAGQYAAVRLPVTGRVDFPRIRFDVEADRPMRLWVQVRSPGGTGERWGRTVFADQVGRTIDLILETFAPIGVTSTERVRVADADSLLFVVDTVNTLPGSEGRVRVSHVAFAR